MNDTERLDWLTASRAGIFSSVAVDGVAYWLFWNHQNGREQRAYYDTPREAIDAAMNGSDA